MEEAEARRAVAAAMSTASDLGLAVEDAVVLNDSNRLVARLLPCDIVARVSPMGWFSAAREVELARRLADETDDAPVAGLDPRVEPRLDDRDGFEIAMWTYFEPVHPGELAPADYADALERLHGALRQVDVSAPHFTDRLAEIRRWLADSDCTPELNDEDRELLADRIANPGPLFLDGGGAEQLLHGERIRGMCPSRRAGRSSWTSRTVLRGRSSSTLRGLRRPWASAIATPTTI